MTNANTTTITRAASTHGRYIRVEGAFNGARYVAIQYWRTGGPSRGVEVYAVREGMEIFLGYSENITSSKALGLVCEQWMYEADPLVSLEEITVRHAARNAAQEMRPIELW